MRLSQRFDEDPTPCVIGCVVMDVSEDGGAAVFRVKQFQEEWN